MTMRTYYPFSGVFLNSTVKRSSRKEAEHMGEKAWSPEANYL
jgi:hypothetical protein